MKSFKEISNKSALVHPLRKGLGHQLLTWQFEKMWRVLLWINRHWQEGILWPSSIVLRLLRLKTIVEVVKTKSTSKTMSSTWLVLRKHLHFAFNRKQIVTAKLGDLICVWNNICYIWYMKNGTLRIQGSLPHLLSTTLCLVFTAPSFGCAHAPTLQSFIKSAPVLHQILTDNRRHHQLPGAHSFSSFIAPLSTEL